MKHYDLVPDNELDSLYLIGQVQGDFDFSRALSGRWDVNSEHSVGF